MKFINAIMFLNFLTILILISACMKYRNTIELQRSQVHEHMEKFHNPTVNWPVDVVIFEKPKRMCVVSVKTNNGPWHTVFECPMGTNR